MTTVSLTALSHDNTPDLARGRMVAYWATTGFLAFNAVMAGVMNILRVQPFFGMLIHLGYPAYFSAILGTWKVLAAVALLAPGYPRVKEWAYAGAFIDYTAAAISYLAIGEGTLSNLVGPILSVGLLIASWALRPATRRFAQ